MEHHLLLMRHAKSDWSDEALPDYARPLSKRGRRDAPRMGRWLAGQPFAPERIVSSPARRAEETAAAVAAALGIPQSEVLWEEALYGANVQSLLYALGTHAPSCTRLLLIGHNPGLEELLHYLTGGVLPAGDDKLMPTATIAHLVSESDPGRLEGGSARCDLVQRPKALDGD